MLDVTDYPAMMIKTINTFVTNSAMLAIFKNLKDGNKFSVVHSSTRITTKGLMKSFDISQSPIKGQKESQL